MPKVQKIKVLMIVLNNFKNDSRVIKEAKSLQNNNYQVKVVALHEEPLKEHEQIENFEVHRIKLFTRSLPKNFTMNILKYIEFLILTIKKYRKHDIIHCNDIHTLPIGVIVKIFINRKAKVIYDAHEYETETNGLRGLRKKGIKVLEKILIKFADKVITVSNSIANEYVRLYQIEKPSLVLNTPHYIEIEKKDLFRKELSIQANQNIFLYQGRLSEGRGIEILLKIFSKLSSNKNVIVFMGYGSLENKIKSVAQKKQNVFFHPSVTPNKILEHTSSADYGISFIEDICLSYRYCLPNKMFEYVMAEIPVICSNLPEMRSIVEKYSLGVVALDTTEQGIQEAVNQIIKQGTNFDTIAHTKIKKIFSWESQEKILLNTYNQLWKQC